MTIYPLHVVYWTGDAHFSSSVTVVCIEAVSWKFDSYYSRSVVAIKLPVIVCDMLSLWDKDGEKNIDTNLFIFICDGI